MNGKVKKPSAIRKFVAKKANEAIDKAVPIALESVSESLNQTIPGSGTLLKKVTDIPEV